MRNIKPDRFAADTNSAQLRLPFDWDVPRDAAAEHCGARSEIITPPSNSVAEPDGSASLQSLNTAAIANSDAGPAIPTSGMPEANKAAVRASGRVGPLAPPGLDQNVLNTLQVQLEADLQPANSVEKIILRDIVRDTALGDYLFDRTMDAFTCLAEDTARDLSGGGEDGSAISKLSLERQVGARTLIDHHPVIAKLIQMQGMVQGGRNASIALFDNRRLNALKAALEAIKL